MITSSRTKEILLLMETRNLIFRTILCFSLLFTFELNSIFAQENNPTCATPSLEDIRVQNPAMYDSINAHALRYRNSTNLKSNVVLTIPIVVHIIYGSELSAEYISDEQVMSQIKALNEDFRKVSGTNGDGNGVDMNIQFCLATKTPSGKKTSGITRHNSSLTVHNWETQEDSLKELIQWPPDKYLNVWVVKSIFRPSTPNFIYFGYSSFPDGAANRDGIVMAYRSFGRIGPRYLRTNLGNTLTHEVGHWLGLFHTFEGGCDTVQITSLNCANRGDKVCDTPLDTMQFDNCLDGKNTCDQEDGNPPDLVHNYMTYYCDSCRNEFSQGQKERAYTYLNDPTSRRNKIIQTENLIAAGCHCTEFDNEASEEWNNVFYVGGTSDYAHCMSVDRSNNVYIGGYEIINGSDNDYRVVKIKEDKSFGNTYNYDHPQYHSIDIVTAMCVDDAGSVYVTGQTMTNNGFEDIYTAKLVKFNNIQWTAYFDGVDQNEDYPSVIKTDANGNVYVAGFTNYANRSEYLLMKYGPYGGTNLGEPLWKAIHGGSDSLADHINDMVIDPSGNIYVTGYTQDTGQKLNITTIKYNSSGTRLWIASFDDINSESQTAYSIQLDSSNNVYIAGRTDLDPTNESFDYKGVILKYTKDGYHQWTYIDSTVNYLRSLKIDQENNIIAGGDNTMTSSADLTVVKLSPQGNRLWRDTINGVADYGDYFKALDVDCSNNIYIVGKTTGDGNLGNGFLTAKIDAVGTVLWRKYFYGPDSGEEIPVGINVTSFGDIYVGGSSYVSTENNYQFAVVKYHQGTVADNVGQEEIAAIENEILVYPNPSNSVVNIRTYFENEQSGNISIYDMNGVLIEQSEFQNQTSIHKLIDVEKYMNGMYFIKIRINESVLLQKFIVGGK